jgi:hypothetical protein
MKHSHVLVLCAPMLLASGTVLAATASAALASASHAAPARSAIHAALASATGAGGAKGAAGPTGYTVNQTKIAGRPAIVVQLDGHEAVTTKDREELIRAGFKPLSPCPVQRRCEGPSRTPDLGYEYFCRAVILPERYQCIAVPAAQGKEKPQAAPPAPSVRERGAGGLASLSLPRPSRDS